MSSDEEDVNDINILTWRGLTNLGTYSPTSGCQCTNPGTLILINRGTFVLINLGTLVLTNLGTLGLTNLGTLVLTNLGTLELINRGTLVLIVAGLLGIVAYPVVNVILSRGFGFSRNKLKLIVGNPRINSSGQAMATDSGQAIDSDSTGEIFLNARSRSRSSLPLYGRRSY